MTAPVIALLVTSLLMIGLSVPLIYQKVPPNTWYGFRIAKTLSDPAIWYPANKLGGQYFLVAGVFQLAACLLILFASPGQLAGFLQKWFVVLITGPLLIATLLWWLQIRKL